MYRKPTDKEKAQAFHDLAFKINFHRTITMNNSAVLDCLRCIDLYVDAHNANGERDEKVVQAKVNQAFWVHIAQNSEIGKKAKK